ncbi:sel1 repeat family protein [Providencia rettgeri]|uniref:tetratricopeptide repeat protein n=1 Tax=Providencia TaxID=586 RepID=UPI001B35D2F2|nr:tetratricopeptide repeat protein [Providencia rettgeri]MBQ0326658.1 sel1 repeat family protein [Providencia rettgeri]
MKYLLLSLLIICNFSYADYCSESYNKYGSDWDKNNLLHHCKQASNGDPESQFALASWFKTEGKNPTETFRWLIASSNSGCGKAKLGIGFLLFKGDGVGKDLGEAYKHFVIASSSGIPLAQYFQGYMLYYGYGVNKDVDKGMELIKSSAAQGTSAAYSHLGYIYEKGDGVERNPGISRGYYILASVAEALTLIRGNKFDCDIYKVEMTQ